MEQSEFPITWIPLTYDPTQSIAVSACPGKITGKKGSTKQLYFDLESLRRQKISLIITLVTEIEIRSLEIDDFNEQVEKFKFKHYTEAISDLSIPRTDRKIAIKKLLIRIMNEVNNKRNVLIHCNAGLGRSGTIAALLIKLMGVYSDPINQVRKFRPGSIETIEQEKFVNEF